MRKMRIVVSEELEGRMKELKGEVFKRNEIRQYKEK